MHQVEAAITSDFTQKYIIPNSENVVLSAFLSSEGASKEYDIEITLEEGAIIGGTVEGGVALHIDNVSMYQNILIKGKGDIQALVGNSAIKTVFPITILNEGVIAGDIETGMDAGDSNVTLHIYNTGRVLAGGGNGGVGGKGADGDNSINVTRDYGFADGNYQWWYGTTEATVQDSFWNGTYLFTNNSISGPTIYYKLVNGYWYQPGALDDGARYKIKRGVALYGTGGLGGAGGIGQGYQQNFTMGDAGLPGTANSRSGAGGAGGNGGDWGKSGEVGFAGGISYYINQQRADNTRSGGAGTAGTNPGKAVVADTAVLVFIGPDIVIPTLDQNIQMEPIDVIPLFEGAVVFYELVGLWPIGITIQDGIIQGAPEDAGDFTTMAVRAHGVVEATSNIISFTVNSAAFVPTVLLNVPLADVAPPVEQTLGWPFLIDNDFLLCTKVTVPAPDPVTSKYAVWYKWQNAGHNIGIYITTLGQMRATYNDDTGFVSATMDTNPPVGSVVEIKVLKSSTLGFIVWFDNVKDTQEHPIKIDPMIGVVLTDLNIGHQNGFNIWDEAMSCVTIYSMPLDITEAQIESISLCANSTTPPSAVLPWLDDYDTVTPPLDPNITTDFSSIKHPKTLYIEGGLDGPSADDMQKYQIVNSNATNFHALRRIQTAGHQFLGRGMSPMQTMEANQYPRPCGQGWNIPFIGSTVNAGDVIDSTNYGERYGGEDCAGGLPIRWWLLRRGTHITQALSSTDSVIQVEDSTDLVQGKYAVIRSGNLSWGNEEIVRLDVVNKTTNTLTVTRGYLSDIKIHNADSYIAQICVGDDGHPLFWQLNLSTQCPIDGNGDRPYDYIPAWIDQQHVSSGTDNMHTDLNRNDYSDLVFKLIMYDVDRNFTLDPLADCNNNGAVDKGFGPNGETWWIDGGEIFYDGIAASAQARGLPQVGGTEHSGGNTGGCNGRQYESYPTGWTSANYNYTKLSTQMAQMSFGDHRMERGPAMNHILFKQGTAAYDYTPDNVTPDNRPFRLAMGMCALEELACHQQARLVADGDPWYDEMGVDVLIGSPTYGKSPLKTDHVAMATAKGWLGDPIINAEQTLGQRQRSFVQADFEDTKDLLLLQGILDLNIDGWSGVNTAVSHDVDALKAAGMNSYNSEWWATRVVSPTFTVSQNVEHVACFEIRASAKRDLRVKLGSHLLDTFSCDTAWKKYVLSFTPALGSSTVAFQIGRYDTDFWVKNVYIFAKNPNVFYREFDNGMVVVNLSNVNSTVNLGSGSYQRILGSNGAGGAPQSPTINDGTVVGNNFIIPARDAVFLVRQQP